jgi:hypothetical protein
MSRPIRRVQEKATPEEMRDILRMIASLLCSGTFTWDPPNVPAGTSVATALTSTLFPAVTGIVAGMPVSVTPPSTLTAGIVVQGWASANNELTINLTNVTAAPINMAAGTWGFMGFTS